MRIVFFGSSHGFPEPNRRCSSILVQVGSSNYFIDMGTQSIEQLATRGIPVESVKGVFITHMHGDHANGLLSFIDLCNWYYKDAHPKFFFPGDIEKTKDAIKGWLSCLKSTELRYFEFNHVDDGFSYQDENIKISAFRTKHIEQSFSYLLEAEGKRVFFSGDLKILTKPTDEAPDLPLEEFDKGFDLAILELAHFAAQDKYYSLLKDRDNIKTICINHYSKFRVGSAYTLMELLPDQNIVMAADGLEFEL